MVFLITAFIVVILLRQKKIVIMQAVSCLLFLNILLLLSVSFLLPGMFNRRLKWWQGLIVGITVSSAIEVSQLVLCRGLFEFDDIIHNSLGCMLGTLVGNKLSKHCE